MALERGLYESLVTELLAKKILSSDPRTVRKSPLRKDEAADRIALHLGRLIQKAISGKNEEDRLKFGIGISKLVVQSLGAKEILEEIPIDDGQVLNAIQKLLPDGSAEEIPLPLIPLLDTTLLTNAAGEPALGNQVLSEILSSDKIDIVMAFIRRSGIRPLLDSLKRHCQEGRELRILTTTYTGSTELEALEQLEGIGAKIRISYDLTSTRLHAKSWLFSRKSGFSTAYVGSSNLTHSAQVSGLEWNVRLSEARNSDVIAKLSGVFEALWQGNDFLKFEKEEFKKHQSFENEKHNTFQLSPIELRPEPFQERILEQLMLAREQGLHKNLIAAATGTGKTVIAAVDYSRMRERLGRARLLFVAHREEIIEQSIATFRQCLRNPSFGEIWKGERRPVQFDHVFAMIQTLNSTGYENLEPDHFDFVIVDEFHHAAADSYDKLLKHVKPKELLGLTATPERGDGQPILHWFGGRIAAELRLWDAINQQRLVPFAYYGIHDGLDLTTIPWKRGRGYDVEKLSNLLTSNEAWVRQVVRSIQDKVDNVHEMRALGFCVSVKHAQYMAEKFNALGIAAVAISGDSKDQERSAALQSLREKRLNIVFSVDLFNEGVDLPELDTLVMLRPTDSPTLFLQQLGRGLRRSFGKTFCTVLDFVGMHRKEFRMDLRFRALLGGSRKYLTEQIEMKFPFLPAGCHMQLDAMASELVLKNIQESIPTRWPAKVEELRSYLREKGSVTLEKYLEESGYELDDIYSGGKCWSDLLQDAGADILGPGPKEKELRSACAKMRHIDDRIRIVKYRELLKSEKLFNFEKMAVREARIVRMLLSSLINQAVEKDSSVNDGWKLLIQHPQIIRELLELLDVLESRVDHLQFSLGSLENVPLMVHARYTRAEILAAFGKGGGATIHPWREGVLWVAEEKSDLLAFTLDKTSGHFSPTTRYRDFAVSPFLIHWESQSLTSAESQTGRRYQEHNGMKSSAMLFARLNSDEKAFWFLGPAKYVKHVSEYPMAITWELHHSIPGDIYGAFAAAVA